MFIYLFIWKSLYSNYQCPVEMTTSRAEALVVRPGRLFVTASMPVMMARMSSTVVRHSVKVLLGTFCGAQNTTSTDFRLTCTKDNDGRNISLINP